MGTPRSLRIIILANTLKKPVCDALEKIRPWLSERARIVAEPDIINFEADAISELPEADLALVLGGGLVGLSIDLVYGYRQDQSVNHWLSQRREDDAS